MHCRLSEVRAARPAAIVLYFYSTRRAFWRGRRPSAELKSRLPCVPGRCREGVRPKCRLVRNRREVLKPAPGVTTLPKRSDVVVRSTCRCLFSRLPHALSWWTADGARRKNGNIMPTNTAGALSYDCSPHRPATAPTMTTTSPTSRQPHKSRVIASGQGQRTFQLQLSVSDHFSQAELSVAHANRRAKPARGAAKARPQ